MSTRNLTLQLEPRDNDAASLPGLDPFSGAKVKLDELFVSWLAQPDTRELVRRLIVDVKAGHPIDLPAASMNISFYSRSGALSPSPSVPAAMRSSPPRSPSRALSPRHFSFEAGERGEKPASPTLALAAAAAPAPVSGATVASGVPSAPRPGTPGAPPAAAALAPGAAAAIAPGAAAAIVPRFFFPHEGGRGRNRAMAGEALEDKAEFTVDVFRSGGDVTAQKALQQTLPRKDIAGAGATTFLGIALAAPDVERSLRIEQFAAVAKTLCGLPSFAAAPLFRRIRLLVASDGTVLSPRPPAQGEPRDGAGESDDGVVTLRQFMRFWKLEMEPYDHQARFFRLVKKPWADYIVPPDFVPLMEELLAFHPGLTFLESTPEFQEKYARTVIARIYYKLDPHAFERISERTLRHSDVLRAFHTVDLEDDINSVNDYFSYEHFYVLYCKFWELDGDHDFLLSREDLSKMEHLTHAALDRVFAQAGRKFVCGVADRMGFEDFVCFLMSEEDKTNMESLLYWFRVVDIDSDGALRPWELRHFYQEQMARMAMYNYEVVPFDDIWTQMIHLLQPANSDEIRFADFIHPSRIRITGAFFSVLFNLQKFMLFEQRDPNTVKQENNEGGVTQWDRFAQIEYARLACEDDDTQDAKRTDVAMELEDRREHAWALEDDDDDTDLARATQRKPSESPF